MRTVSTLLAIGTGFANAVMPATLLIVEDYGIKRLYPASLRAG